MLTADLSRNIPSTPKDASNESSGTNTTFSIHSPNLEDLLEGSILAVAIESNTGTKTWCLGMIDEVESLSKITMSFVTGYQVAWEKVLFSFQRRMTLTSLHQKIFSQLFPL